MASNSMGDEDPDAVLSDVEGDDPLPIAIKSISSEEISVDRFRELLAELDHERKAREAEEKSKLELQGSFNRLKVLAHEAIKKRDDCIRQRDDALREKEEALKSNEVVSGQLAEANRLNDKVSKLKDEITSQLDEVVRERDGLKSEIGNASHMLVTGIDKISGKVKNFKNFTAGGLPRSQKYTGLPAIVYGVIKRTNEIVEELVRQIDATAKSRNETREQMEYRNYEIAIEVSQLEATISGLREEVTKKTSLIENLEKVIVTKDERISENEREILAKVNMVENEASELKQLAHDYDVKLKTLESKLESQKPLLNDQLSFVSKIHDTIYNVLKIVDACIGDSDFTESFFLPQESDSEEHIRASLAGMESVYELTKVVIEKTRYLMEEKSREIKDLDETVARLIKEKQHIGSLLRSALSTRMTSDPSSKSSQLFQVAENGLKEAGIEFKFSKLLENENVPNSSRKENLPEVEDEIYSLAGALENIVKVSQVEIIELRHSLEELRAESSLLKEHLEVKSKEHNYRMRQIEELEEKERIANESIEGLMMDIAASEEEISRWKVAAEQEAAAGRAVEQDFMGQLSALKQKLEEEKQAMMESEKKLKFKEETAAAAMAARDAAEKSLRLADMRASRLRDRVEELTRQLEEYENKEDIGRGRNGPKYVCWPWQWLGLDIVGSQRSDINQPISNEMELSEPLL